MGLGDGRASSWESCISGVTAAPEPSSEATAGRGAGSAAGGKGLTAGLLLADGSTTLLHPGPLGGGRDSPRVTAGGAAPPAARAAPGRPQVSVWSTSLRALRPSPDRASCPNSQGCEQGAAGAPSVRREQVQGTSVSALCPHLRLRHQLGHLANQSQGSLTRPPPPLSPEGTEEVGAAGGLPGRQHSQKTSKTQCGTDQGHRGPEGRHRERRHRGPLLSAGGRVGPGR